MTNLVDQTQRALGNNVRISPLGYGCWRLVNMPMTEARERIEHVLAHGMNLIDTADVYGLDWGGTAFGSAEELLGEVLKDAPGLRDQMVLASKGGIIPGVPYDSANLEQACNDSLRRLGVECLDLYQIHRPDMLTHPEETARVLQRLKDSGKVRAFGVSNYTTDQTSALMAYLPGEIISQQLQYSALHLDPLFDGTFDQCMQHQQTLLVWSPLAGGRLGDPSTMPDGLVSVLQTLAEREGVDLPTIGLAFVLAHPARPVALLGSLNLERLTLAQQALRVQLDRADVYQVIQAAMGESLP
ncbi:MAG: aldo/keto reductase [Gammaproteobacteria bacterium]|nr:aldo/keto reductase [Gammaproteobacteria bacterium]